MSVRGSSTQASLENLLTLRRLREQQAAARLVKAQTAATKASAERDVAARACRDFALERKRREMMAYAGLAAGQPAVPARTIYALAAQMAEDASHEKVLDETRSHVESVLVKVEAGLHEAERVHAASRRHSERLDSLREQLAATTRLAEEAREEEALLEEMVRRLVPP